MPDRRIWHDTRVTPDEPADGRLADLPDPAALLFDLDGTLVDTVPVRITAWCAALQEDGIAATPEIVSGHIGSDGRLLAKEVARATGREIDDAAAERLDARHGEIFDELNTSPVPLSGAASLLAALERAGVAFAVATSSQPGQVIASVRALRLPEPPRVVDGSHVALAKPAPDLLLAGARQLDAAPERCWYVGDSTWDMIAAVRAGMAGIGVPTGAASEAILLRAGAAAVVASLDDLLAELRRRGLLA